MINRRTLLAVGTSLLLAGCIAVEQNARICRGRFSMRSDIQGKIETNTGRFELLSRPGLLRLDLLTPLSGVILRVESTPTGASIERPGDETPITGASLQNLMRQTVGFSLPMAILEALVSSDRCIEDDLETDGWRLKVLSRMSDGSPKSLRLIRTTPYSMTITLAIEDAIH